MGNTKQLRNFMMRIIVGISLLLSVKCQQFPMEKLTQMQEIINAAQIEMDKLTPPEFKERMLAETSSCVKSSPSEISAKFTEDKSSIWSSLPSAVQLAVGYNQEKFFQYPSRALADSKITEDVVAQIKGQIALASANHMQKQMADNPCLKAEKFKFIQDDMLKSLDPSVAAGIRTLEEETNQKLSAIEM